MFVEPVMNYLDLFQVLEYRVSNIVNGLQLALRSFIKQNGKTEWSEDVLFLYSECLVSYKVLNK